MSLVTIVSKDGSFSLLKILQNLRPQHRRPRLRPVPRAVHASLPIRTRPRSACSCWTAVTSRANWTHHRARIRRPKRPSVRRRRRKHRKVRSTHFPLHWYVCVNMMVCISESTAPISFMSPFKAPIPNGSVSKRKPGNASLNLFFRKVSSVEVEKRYQITILRFNCCILNPWEKLLKVLLSVYSYT